VVAEAAGVVVAAPGVVAEAADVVVEATGVVVEAADVVAEAADVVVEATTTTSAASALFEVGVGREGAGVVVRRRLQTSWRRL
jgi:hypothetical protein